jgi:hypothetical protein
MEKEKKRCEWEKFGWISKLRISNHAPSGLRLVEPTPRREANAYAARFSY